MTAVPEDWPPEAESEFERIKVLGRGAFGEVWLAKRRHSPEAAVNNDDPSQEDYVAIKGVSIENEQEVRTAAREIAILEELNHPNIIQLLKGYEPASPDALGRYLALSFVEGKELGDILEERGALPLSLARLVARHLISAVAYLVRLLITKSLFHYLTDISLYLMSNCPYQYLSYDLAFFIEQF